MQSATGGYVQLETLVSKHSWQIKADEIELVKRLAEGTYGVVWDGRWKDRRVAIKVLKIGGVDSEGDQLDVGADEDFERECAALEKIDHSHLLKFYGVGHLASTRAGFIVTELLALGSLRQVLQDRSHDLPWHVRTSIACQLARGMEALHGMQPPMIHRDLKVTLSQCPPNDFPFREYDLLPARFSQPRAPLYTRFNFTALTARPYSRPTPSWT